MIDVRPGEKEQLSLNERLIMLWQAWVAAVVLVLALGLLAWVVYWKATIAPTIFETAHAKCMGYVTDATDEQCRCTAAFMVERLGEYS